MIAVLLLAFGGPATVDEVEPFLSSVISGRKLTTEQLARVTEKYKFIGGRSPLTEITLEQAKLLEDKLNMPTKKYRVYVGTLHAHPTIEETVKEIFNSKIREIIVLSLAPYYSKVTTAAYIEKLKKAIKEIQTNGEDFKISVAGHLGDYPLYLDAVIDKIEEGLKQFSLPERENIYIIFSVHSIPQKFIDQGDPYLEQIKTTIEGILKISSYPRWKLAFQSAGSDKEEWLEPEVKEVIDELAKEGVKNILLVPLSFIADNIETLYDIDIVYKKYAEEKGLKFVRSACLNTSPKFIEALSNIVMEQRGEK